MFAGLSVEQAEEFILAEVRGSREGGGPGIRRGARTRERPDGSCRPHRSQDRSAFPEKLVPGSVEYLRLKALLSEHAGTPRVGATAGEDPRRRLVDVFARFTRGDPPPITRPSRGLRAASRSPTHRACIAP